MCSFEINAIFSRIGIFHPLAFLNQHNVLTIDIFKKSGIAGLENRVKIWIMTL